MKYLILFAVTGVSFIIWMDFVDKIKSIKLLILVGILTVAFVIVAYNLLEPWFNAN